MNVAALNARAEDQVKEFQTVMGQTMTIPLALSMVVSESVELDEAVRAIAFQKPTLESLAHCLHELADFTYTMVGLNLAIEESGGKFTPSSADEFEWMLKLSVGANAALQLNQYIFDDQTIADAITIVHQSNLTKVGADGKPVFNADGKVTKGPNYKAPDLTALAAPFLDLVTAMWQTHVDHNHTLAA
jgi:hypothetical protein